MSRYLLFGLVVSALTFTACASKKKPADPAGEPDATITSTPMQFDPQGSDSGKIPGLNTVHFDYDQATLSSEARRQLAENAEWIKNNANVVVQVEGHCDSRGSVEYNLALGERRAKAVKNYLVSLGIEPKRLTIISYGEEKPVSTGDSEEAYSKNRRANFVPLPQ